jgi:RNA polymerase sigma factor (sigma-70 family)
VRSDDDADDVCAEAFLELRERIPPGSDAVEDMVQELFKIVRSKLRMYRHRRQLAMREQEPESDRMPATETDPEQLLGDVREDAVKMRLIGDALEEMSEEAVLLIDLAYRRGLPREQVASMVGCTPETLDVKLHRARCRLRELVGPRYEMLNGSRRER